MDELATEMAAEGADSPAATASGESRLDVRYAIEFEPKSVPRLCQEHGLVFPTA